ncbi:MAG: hypothetical protein ACREBO_00995 [Novosphingobium sp.]
MYPADWHRIYGDKTGESARRILPPLIALFGARSLVEIGCGNAHWTQAGIDAGIGEYTIVDGPWNDRAQLLVDPARFVEADLAAPLRLPRRFDLALCTEVAEHLAEDSAEVLVDSLVAAADVVVFGAAIPYQGGYGHINERWPSWWRALFEQRGYRAFDLVRPRHWTDPAIHYWYRQNTFVYVAEAAGEAIRAAAEAERPGSTALFDAVHPEKFEEVAAYRSIAFRRLARRFPAWLALKLRERWGRPG